MNLILVNGLPATGKTTIARTLSATLDMPVISKDVFKEFLFDTIKAKDREWSKVLGGVSNDFVYILADKLLTNGESIIIENAFEYEFAKPNLEKLLKGKNINVTEVYCTTDKNIRRNRFKARQESGDRHLGHVDSLNYLSDNEPEPLEKYRPIELAGSNFIHIDTTDVSLDDTLEMILKHIPTRVH